MNRKSGLVFVLMLLFVSLTVTACRIGGTQTPQGTPGQTQETGQEPETQPTQEQPEEQEPNPGEVPEEEPETPPEEEELVTLSIPAVYESVSTQEEADEICRNNGYESVVLNEDGSLTVTMRSGIYRETVKQFTAAVDQRLKEMAGAGVFPQIRAVEHNEDYSIFTVKTDSEMIVPPEEYLAEELIMYGTLYHYYTGSDTEEIRVVYVDGASGKVLKELSSGGLE